jgi:PAS domain S-box-containing protein
LFDSVMNAAPCGYVAVADDGTVTEVNQTALDMLGFTRFELLGWHLEKVLPPGGRIFYHTHVFPLLKLQGQIDEIYIALRTKEGRDLPVLLNGVRRSRNGRFLSECVFMRMLQRHEYEEQLLQARRLAEEANAAKAKFLSMMSHDLRTPLTTVQGHADLLQRGAYGTLDGDQRSAVDSIVGASRMLTTMIGDILEFARLDSGPVQVAPSPVSLQDAIARAESLLRVQLQAAEITFVNAAAGEDVAAIADAGKLQQILLNLLTNAIKFTPPGGTITVRCEGDAKRVRIVVCDTGIGIAQDDLQRIFSPFVQVSSAPERPGHVTVPPPGVGLGLSIGRELARAMDGDVSVESTPGAGSKFTIELPAAADDVPALAT